MGMEIYTYNPTLGKWRQKIHNSLIHMRPYLSNKLQTNSFSKNHVLQQLLITISKSTQTFHRGQRIYSACYGIQLFNLPYHSRTQH
ncbi:hypothetical protein I79_014905 [Cricetulus griseus]|uniref:Uncharacterized protein n=1 Tax=Cricetulus griseus TaxID=10029 RepID=G3HVC3_CRIGR|nr:hypothetical protein I79_014905 [Cricetulus griseus]